jgi:hypothetical protein
MLTGTLGVVTIIPPMPTLETIEVPLMFVAVI